MGLGLLRPFREAPDPSVITGGIRSSERYDGASQNIYVDGILAASNAVPEGSVIDLNAWNVCIGADDELEGQREFKGLIDEVRIYEIGLSLPAQVLGQFIADGGHDSCGINYLPGDLNKDCYIEPC